jgi:N-acetyl-alpha-D-muramate 1-phosphate uridylyltransferase
VSAIPFSVAVLAGGLATRLNPLTESIPKSLVDIQGKPFLQIQLQLLQQKGIQHVVLCIGHLGEKIVEAAGDGSEFGLRISYSFDGPVLLGTAGSIKKALPLLSDPFFVLYGDSYLDCDYEAIASSFLQSGKKALMTVYKNEERWDNSNVEFCNGQIVAYNKTDRTGSMRHIDYGLGFFQKNVFDSVSEGAVYDLGTLYQQLIQQNQLAAFEVYQRFYEVGSQEGIEEFREFIARNK